MKKTAIVTGGNRGLGFLISQKLANQGFHVVLASRNAKNGAEAVARITKANAAASVETMLLDAGSLASVRTFVAEIEKRDTPVHALVNNAGMMQTPGHGNEKSADGIEQTFATNHVGSALLSMLLLDKLRASAPARIVNVASRAHMGFPGMGGPAKFDFDDINSEKSFDGTEAYKNSKLAMIWFTYALARKLKDKSVTVNAVCPGFVPETIADQTHGFQRFMFAHVMTHVPGAHTAAEASDNVVAVVTAPAFADATGQFIGEQQPIKSSPESYDEAKQQRLWDLTLKLANVDTATLQRLKLA